MTGWKEGAVADRKTLERKRKRQRQIDRYRAELQAKRYEEQHERDVREAWMRFVAVRFPNSYASHDDTAADQGGHP